MEAVEYGDEGIVMTDEQWAQLLPFVETAREAALAFNPILWRHGRPENYRKHLEAKAATRIEICIEEAKAQRSYDAFVAMSLAMDRILTVLCSSRHQADMAPDHTFTYNRRRHG